MTRQHDLEQSLLRAAAADEDTAGGGTPKKTTSKKAASKKRSSKKTSSKKRASKKKAGSKKSASKKATTKASSKKASSKKASSKKRSSKKAPSKKRQRKKVDTAAVAEAEAAVAEASGVDPTPTDERVGGRREGRPVPDLKARSRERLSRAPRDLRRRKEEAEEAAAEDGGGVERTVAEAASKTPASAAKPDRKPRGKTDAKWEEIFAGKTFRDLGLRKTVLRALDEAGFASPTKIQAEMVPLAMKGVDIMGQSRTGSGKTAAFGLPVVNNSIRGLEFQTIILAPTRELAIQITDELSMFAKYTPLQIATVYGGQKIETQAKKLSKRPEIIVATPGRLMDMMNRGYLHLGNVRFAILDEVDRMLDIGFRDDIRKILGAIRSTEHQTVFVSATISEEIEQLSRKFMRKDAERLETTGGSLTVSLVDQRYIPVEPWDKSRLLSHLIEREEPELALVFCRMKRTVDKITANLRRDGVKAEAIHGDLPQRKRDKIMKDLRAGHLHVLVASDLAARGIDVAGITHVINFDLPDDPEIYVHRIGRTARAGRGGVAFSFVSPEQGPLLTQVEILANTHIPPYEIEGFKPGPVPENVVEERQKEEERKEMLKGRNRYAASKPALPADQKLDQSKFPGGVVPAKLPKRRLGGRMKTNKVIQREQVEKSLS